MIRGVGVLIATDGLGWFVNPLNIKNISRNIIRGFRITGINEEMTQTLTTVIIISNPEKWVFFEILINNSSVMIMRKTLSACSIMTFTPFQ